MRGELSTFSNQKNSSAALENDFGRSNNNRSAVICVYREYKYSQPFGKTIRYSQRDNGRFQLFHRLVSSLHDEDVGTILSIRQCTYKTMSKLYSEDIDYMYHIINFCNYKVLMSKIHNSFFNSASHVTSHFKTIQSYIVLRCRATFLQVSLGGIEELAKRKGEVRVACGLPASYELQCPPQQPIDNERIPAPHTPPPGSDSDSNGEIIWDRSEEEPQEQRHRPPKPRPKVRY